MLKIIIFSRSIVRKKSEKLFINLNTNYIIDENMKRKDKWKILEIDYRNIKLFFQKSMQEYN